MKFFKARKVGTRFIVPLLILATQMAGYSAPKTRKEIKDPVPGWKTLIYTKVKARPYTPLVGGTDAVSRELSTILPSKQRSGPLKRLASGPILQSVFAIPANTDADYRTADIINLAAGLNNDREEIYNWVRKNIRFTHYYGCKKGAQLTLLERSGNDVDQSALLVALWRAAGIDCRYVVGMVELPGTASLKQVDWYYYMTGFNQQYSRETRIPLGGTPDADFQDGSTPSTFRLRRMWVQAYVDNAWLDYDPSFKLLQPRAKMDIAALSGYSRSNMLSSLGTGTPGSNSMTSLNYAGLKSYMTARAMQFITNYKANYSTLDAATIMGEWTPLANTYVDNNTFPIRAAGYYAQVESGKIYDTIPVSYYHTILLKARSNFEFGPVNVASLRGKTLALYFGDGKAILELGGTWVAGTTSNISANEALKITVDYRVPGDTRGTDNDDSPLSAEFDMTVFGKGMYAFVYGFDVSAEYVRSAQQRVGYPLPFISLYGTDFPKLESLNVMGLQFLQQVSLVDNMLAAFSGLDHTGLFQFGRVAEERSSSTEASVYIDFPSSIDTNTMRTQLGMKDVYDNLSTASFFASALEHGVIEQNQPNIANAMSSTKILKIANDQGIPLHLAKSDTYYGPGKIKQALDGYTSSDKALFDSVVDSVVIDSEGPVSGRVFLPESGEIQVDQWEGKGYRYAKPYLVGNTVIFSVYDIISGNLSGGYSATPEPLKVEYVSSQAKAAVEQSKTPPAGFKPIVGGDPVDLVSGDFTHERELLTAGTGPVRGLNFTVDYHGARRFSYDAHLGNGWSHNYMSNVVERADIEGAFGELSPIEMAGTLVGVYAAWDAYVNKNDDDPASNAKSWLSSALIANWVVDELKGSAITVDLGSKSLQFRRQADGSYLPPPGATQTLAKNSSGNYEVTERHGPIWRFNSDKKLQEIEDPWGKKALFTYNSEKLLKTVTDCHNRTLTFQYMVEPGESGGLGQPVQPSVEKGRLLSVSDNGSPARTVSFDYYVYSANPFYEDYTGKGALLTISDPEGKRDKFSYDDDPTSGLLGGLLTKYMNEDGQTIVQNIYGSTGRVASQYTAGDSAQLWKYSYAPGKTTVEEPLVGSPAITTHYFDSKNREVEVKNALGHRTVTTYDTQNRVVGLQRIVSDGSGSFTDSESFTYDAHHNLLTETNARGKTTTYAYNANDELTSVTDKRGHVQYFQNYNAQHQPTQIVDRAGKITTVAYKPVGDVAAGEVASIAEGGFTTSYGYDSRGVLNSVSHPGGASEGRVNNYFGDPVTVTDPLNRETTITYNKRREVLTQTSPGTLTSGPRTVTTTYDNRRNVASVQNARGFTTSSFFSATRKLLTTTLPGNAVITNHYNKRDQVDWISDPLGKVTNFTYDAVGRTLTVTDPLSRTVSSIYEDGARQTTSQSPAPLNIQTKAKADSLGQVVRDENGMGQFAVPGYDDNGNQTSWVDRRGKIWSFTFDNEDRRLTFGSPQSRTTAQTWNGKGLLETITEPSLQTTTLGYDGRKRMTSRTDAVGTVSYGLDAAGQLLTVTEGSNVLTRTFHPSGEVATYTNANGETITYDYDKNGNLTSLTYPSINDVPAATVTYTYDNRDRLSSVKDWAGRVTTYTWDEVGRLTKISRPNGTKRTLRWDDAGQLLGFEERPIGGAPIAARSFSYDSAGRLNKRLSYPQGALWTEPSWTALYDDDNRLETLAGIPLNYDADGNLLGSKLPDGAWGASGASTNANGTYRWNARNQLTRVTRADNGQQIDYVYDAEGNLIQTTDSVEGTTRWIIDPDGGGRSRVLARVAPDGKVTRYVYGAELLYEIRNDGAMRCYHYDQIGSTVAVSNSYGSVVGTADYTPYGRLVGGAGELGSPENTPFMFVGAHGVITDSATGLQQMRARWYSSHVRRFLNQDPIGFAGGENFYSYAQGNPVMLVDPTGNVVETVWDVANIGMGLWSLGDNVSKGNWWWAAADVAGLAYDGVATAVPFLPAGASAGLKAMRVGNGIVHSINVGSDVAKVTKLTDRAAKTVDMSSSARAIGTDIHSNVAAQVKGKLEAFNSTYMGGGANKYTGVQPDLKGDKIWGDITTVGQWDAHVKKYEKAGFGEGIPILYKPGKGVVGTSKIFAGAGTLNFLK